MKSSLWVKGKSFNQGTPVDIYDEPINRFVADFIGESNIVDGVMKEDYLVEFVGKEFECADAGMRPNEKLKSWFVQKTYR